MFSGALGPKRKADLQEIATALKLSSEGTREELQGRIKKHLDDNQHKLEDNPKYAGLYVKKRKGSVQPQEISLPDSAPSSSGPSSDERPSASPARVTRQSTSKSILTMDPLRETSVEVETVFTVPTPAGALHDISTMLKNPSRRDVASPSLSRASKRRELSADTDADSDAENVPLRIAGLSHAGPKDLVLQSEKQVIKSGMNTLQKTRNVLSDARNIYSTSSIVEFLAVLMSAMQLEWNQPEHSPVPLPVTSLATFTTPYFWTVLLHWAIPTVVAPLIIGNLISFSRPAAQHGTPSRFSITRVTQNMDPMTASIARFFIHYVYPYSAFNITHGRVTGTTEGVTAAGGGSAPIFQTVDVLGPQWRLWSAGLILAFSFAEGISQSINQPRALVLHEHKD